MSDNDLDEKEEPTCLAASSFQLELFVLELSKRAFLCASHSGDFAADQGLREAKKKRRPICIVWTS